jgi:serine/threonine protein kinase
MVGRTISHYEIIEKLGEGGMGVIYKARDAHLDRFVAIKALPLEKVADAERKRRFVLEAKSASALNHPNIITIHDIASDHGVELWSDLPRRKENRFPVGALGKNGSLGVRCGWIEFRADDLF